MQPIFSLPRQQPSKGYIKLSITVHTGYGRTRKPKPTGLSGTNSEVQWIFSRHDSTPENDGRPSPWLFDPEIGYKTENQRYLHLTIEDNRANGDAVTIIVMGLVNSFGLWSPLYEVDYDTDADLEDESDAPAHWTVWFKIQSTPGSTSTRVFQIAGVDRVFFRSVSAHDPNIKLYAFF